MKLFESNRKRLVEALDDKAILKKFDELVDIQKKEGYKSPKIKLNPEMDVISEFSRSGSDTTYIKKLLKDKRKLTEAADISLADKHLNYYEKEILENYKRQQNLLKASRQAIKVLKEKFDIKLSMVDFQVYDNSGFIFVKFAAVDDLTNKFADQIMKEMKQYFVYYDKAKSINMMFQKFDVGFAVAIPLR